jgi:2-polyprenyl-3-methyl-5-hydroxy-6-metoxy-1,4-benzoquinol methylase
MTELHNIDEGKMIDWVKASKDYARFRPGPPRSFYKKLKALGVGLKGQNILDLRTGTGLMARQFAKNGALVFGTDISEEQITMAKSLAIVDGLNIDFQVSASETFPFEDHKFDVITVNQSWLFFDKSKVIPEVKRLLKPNGVLVTSHFSWLPKLSEVARASEQLILKYNPEWSVVNYAGKNPAQPRWAIDQFDVKAMFHYDEEISFNQKTWRGRVRACPGVGAAFSEKGSLAAFEQEHKAMLSSRFANRFTVAQEIGAHIFQSISDH